VSRCRRCGWRASADAVARHRVDDDALDRDAANADAASAMTAPRFDFASLGPFCRLTARASDCALAGVRGGRGEPLVLLSGWPQSMYSWHRVMPRLAESYDVVALDLPGLGDSDQPQDGYDGATVARRVHEALRALGLESFYLVTHDIGTWVSFPFAHEYGGAVRKLVMMDAAIPGLFAPPPDPKLWHFGFNQQRGLGEALTAGRERIFLEWFFRNRSRVHDAITERDLDEYQRVYAAPGGMAAGFEFYRQMPVTALQNQAFATRGPLPMPVLVLGSDTPLGPVMVEALGGLCARLTGRIIAGGGHYLPEEKPGEVLAEVLAFLAA
jgi:pimeloyl-ACP methyl ester carboxylesterase